MQDNQNKTDSKQQSDPVQTETVKNNMKEEN